MTVTSAAVQATRQVKGILNKLTPENFDRLLQQILEIVTDAEILHSTISLVFENAVAQPTFAFMYAQLCDCLSKVRLASCGLILSLCGDSAPPGRILSAVAAFGVMAHVGAWI